MDILRTETPQDDWPPWTDNWVWELDPDPSEEDAHWATENLNHQSSDDADPDPDDPVWDRWAQDHDAMSRYERGIGL